MSSAGKSPNVVRAAMDVYLMLNVTSGNFAASTSRASSEPPRGPVDTVAADPTVAVPPVLLTVELRSVLLVAITLSWRNPDLQQATTLIDCDEQLWIDYDATGNTD